MSDLDPRFPERYRLPEFPERYRLLTAAEAYKVLAASCLGSMNKYMEGEADIKQFTEEFDRLAADWKFIHVMLEERGEAVRV